MLHPLRVVTAVVEAWRSIDALVDILQGDPLRIAGFEFIPGQDNQLFGRVYAMKIPGVMVAWDGTQGGNFNGTEIWKHNLGVYMRASGTSRNYEGGLVGNEEIWWYMMNGHVLGTQLNIRQIQLLPELDIMDTPSVYHRVDENKNDMFQARISLPEIGDN